MPLPPPGCSTTTQAGPFSNSAGASADESTSDSLSIQLVSTAGGSGGFSPRSRGIAIIAW